MNRSEQEEKRSGSPAGFVAWAGAGILFMTGCIAPVGFLLWIPAAILAVLLALLGLRSLRYFFAFVCGIGLTVFVLGAVNGTYVIMLFFGGIMIAGGIVFFAAFGPRTSHADPPSGGE